MESNGTPADEEQAAVIGPVIVNEPRADGDGAAMNPQGPADEQIKLAQRVQTRLEELIRRQAEIKVLEEASKKRDLVEEEDTKVKSKGSVDALILELQNLIKPPKKEPAPQTRRQKKKAESKMKLEVRLAAQSMALANQAEGSSFSKILVKDIDDQILAGFEAFCTRFTKCGQAKSLCTGIAKSMLVCCADTMTIKYADLEAHDSQLAMRICRLATRIMPKLTNAARNFLYQVWAQDLHGASSEETRSMSNMMKGFKLYIEGLPQSHTTLEVYMRQPMRQSRELNNTKFDSPTHKANVMVREIIRELIQKHIMGLSYDGKFSVSDIEVYNESQFKITKSPVHEFDPTAEITDEIAKWFLADFTVVWDSVCMKVCTATAKFFPPHYPALGRKLTKTKLKVFRNPQKLEALRTVLIHNPASKPDLVRSSFLSGVHTACRGYDMNDPEAPFKNVLFGRAMPGPCWSDQIRRSKNPALTDVLDYNINQNDQMIGRNVNIKYRIRGVDKDFDTFKEFLQYLQTHSHEITGPTFGAFVDYSRHLSNHGLKSGMEELEFDNLPVDESGIQYKVLMNGVAREQSISDLGLLESAAALFVESGLTEMIAVLLEEGAMTGMLAGFFEIYKNSG